MHQFSLKQVFEKLKSRESGLTDLEAQNRQKKYGLNEIKKEKNFSVWLVFVRQFENLMTWLLLSAMAFSFFLGEYLDFAVIGLISVFNILLGFIQEYRAGKIALSLANFIEPKAVVLRNNQKKLISVKELTIGDIVFLESGNIVPADCYLIKAHDLQMNESSLTGESLPVIKVVGNLSEETIVAERKNILYCSTVVVSGVASAMIFQIGKNTEIGKIVKNGQAEKRKIMPLERKIKKLGGQLAGLVFVFIAVIFVVGLFSGVSFLKMLYTAISLAVAAVPEGLPSVVTLTLAIGAVKLMKSGLLVKKLSAVETLGETTVIASDKTGTITENRLTVEKVWAINKEFSNKDFQTKNLLLLKKAAQLCNNAWRNDWNYFGDPLEIALLKFSDEKNSSYKRISEIPFSSEKKLMSVIAQKDDQEETFSKGAPEIIWQNCQYIFSDGQIKEKTLEMNLRFAEILRDWAEQSLRMIAFSTTTGRQNIFLGLVGLLDPPRQSSALAVSQSAVAGVDFFMLTGDYEATAMAIAKKVNITGRILNGQQLEKMTERELEAEINKGARIFARILPKHKAKILDILQSRGEIVAMTGDGVNDVPALRAANLGVTFKEGSDFAKSSSEAIITDGGLSSIVEAIGIGRQIFNNIRKFLLFLLSGNLAELLLVFGGIIFDVGTLLLPVQILWINLITDGLPALALGLEPVNMDVMKRPPNRPDERILTKGNYAQILFFGCVMAGLSFIVFRMFSYDSVYAGTMAFNCLVFLQMVNVLNVRSVKSIFKNKFFRNKYLFGAVLISIIMQFTAVYSPLNKYLHLAPVKAKDWLIILAFGFLVLVIGEIYKKLFRKKI